MRISPPDLVQESQAIFLELGEAYRRDYALARYCWTDQQEPTEENYLACRDLFHEANDLFWESECDKDLANAYLFRWQEPEKAISTCEKGLAIKRKIGDLDGQAAILGAAVFYELINGNERRSVDLQQLCIHILDQAGNRRFAASSRCDLANFFIQRGNNEDAANLLEIANSLARTLYDPSLTMYCDMVQGYLTLERGEYEQAVRACENVLELNEDFPYGKITHIFYILARAAISRGGVSQARAALKDMLDHNAIVDGESRLRIMHALGLLFVQEGKWVRAATWLGARDAMCAQSYWASHYFSPMERGAADQARAASRAALGEEAFSAAWEEGRKLTVEQVLQFAQAVLADPGVAQDPAQGLIQ
jgi:tetratricopeptide (TPR) repeat protein